MLALMMDCFDLCVYHRMPRVRECQERRLPSTCCEPCLTFLVDFPSRFVLCSCSYSQETPTRFKKELVKAAQGKDLKNTSLVQVDSLNQILINIGRPEDRLSEDELKTLLNEAGCSEDSRYIPVATMMQLM